MRGDDRACNHGLAGSGRRDQHPQIVSGQDLDGRLLLLGQHGRAGDCLRSATARSSARSSLLPACAASSLTEVLRTDRYRWLIRSWCRRAALP
jgi:hypothetical protein